MHLLSSAVDFLNDEVTKMNKSVEVCRGRVSSVSPILTGQGKVGKEGADCRLASLV